MPSSRTPGTQTWSGNQKEPLLGIEVFSNLLTWLLDRSDSYEAFPDTSNLAMRQWEETIGLRSAKQYQKRDCSIGVIYRVAIWTHLTQRLTYKGVTLNRLLLTWTSWITNRETIFTYFQTLSLSLSLLNRGRASYAQSLNAPEQRPKRRQS
jgi:hypothetical protein